MGSWISIQTFANTMEADIAKGQLEAQGIPCRTQLSRLGDALLAGVGIQTGPTEVLVPEERAEEAKRLLL